MSWLVGSIGQPDYYLHAVASWFTKYTFNELTALRLCIPLELGAGV